MIDTEFYGINVKEIMKSVEKKEIPIVSADAPVDYVLKMLRNNGHAWVVDTLENRKLLGIITEKDFLNIISPLPRKTWITGITIFKTIQRRELKNASDLMTRNPLFCGPDDTIENALDLIRDHDVRKLAVIDQKKLVGEIDLSAIIVWYTSCSLIGRPSKNDD